MAVLTPAWMAPCDLPQAWQGRDAWRVLDIDFADGTRFFPLWDAWSRDARAARMLHVVAIAASAPDPDTLARAMAAFPALRPHARDQRRPWFGLLPGFHRLVLHDARLLLTLCIGPMQTVLRELQFEADSILLDAAGKAHAPTAAQAPAWDKRSLKGLTRLSRRGTALTAWPGAQVTPDQLQQCGFIPHRSEIGSAAQTSAAGVRGYQFEPHWNITTTRSPWRHAPAAVGHCVVIGAGLAGASVADALAARGWQVTVLDGAADPAAGASALPVGLLAPQVSRDDNPRSRLTRAGIRLSLQAAARLLEHGQDWAWTGIAEYDLQARIALPASWPPEGRQWSRWGLPDTGTEDPQDPLVPGQRALWHAGAGWIKPARLVRACLSRPAVRFIGSAAVRSIIRRDGAWQVRDATGAVLAQAPQLVIACAGDATRLINQALPELPGGVRLAPLAAVQGQVSWANHGPVDAALFPRFPVNGSGSVVAHVPHGDGTAWFAGATYTPVWSEPSDRAAPTAHSVAAADHVQNQQRIAQLLPAAARALAPMFENGQVQSWRATRWTTPDRLPLAGAVDPRALPGLWVSAGMGSRGLTYAVLCAELIAAQIGAEPLPIEARLLAGISASRRGLLHHL